MSKFSMIVLKINRYTYLLLPSSFPAPFRFPVCFPMLPSSSHLPPSSSSPLALPSSSTMMSRVINLRRDIDGGCGHSSRICAHLEKVNNATIASQVDVKRTN